MSFCGYATVASAVAYAQRRGTGELVFHTRAGAVAIRTADAGGQIRVTLTSLDYDFDALAELMAASGWTTVDLIYPAPGGHMPWSRNPFPPGGVVEDPATGAAAAAFGGYLRELGLIGAPAQIIIRQGDDMGRPGVLRVDIPQAGGIDVSGTAGRRPFACQLPVDAR